MQEIEYRYGTIRYRGIILSSASPATNPAPGKYRNRKTNRNKKINGAFAYIVPICRRARAGQLRETRYKF